MSRAFVAAALSMALLSVMDAIIKLLAARYPTFQVAFLRFGFGFLMIAAIVAAFRPDPPAWDAVRANVLRGFTSVVSATAFFHGLGLLPLADAVALSFIAPILIALFGMLLLKEPFDRRVAAALAIGFAGVLVVVGGQVGQGSYGEKAWIGVGAVLLSAVAYAFSIVQLRARATVDSLFTIVFIVNLVPALVLAGPAAYVWTPPVPADWALFVLIGVLGVGGHFLLTWAFARASAGRLAPVEYTVIFWATLLGYAWFGEAPGLATLAGAALIILSAVVTGRK